MLVVVPPHDQPAEVLQLDDREVQVDIEQLTLPGLEFSEHLLELLHIKWHHVQLVVLVVKVQQLRESIGTLGQLLIALVTQRLGLGVALGAIQGLVDARIAGLERQMGEALDGDVAVVGGVEPAAPEPVEIDGAGVPRSSGASTTTTVRNPPGRGQARWLRSSGTAWCTNPC